MTCPGRWMKTSVIAGLCLFFAVTVTGTGCGKKTPPRAPEKPGQAVAAPENPTATLSEGQLILTWTHEIDPDNAALSPRYFEVFMAAPAECEGCPFVFEPAGRVAVPDMRFQVPLPASAGVRYVRVQAVGDNDVRSEYSRTVVVAVP